MINHDVTVDHKMVIDELSKKTQTEFHLIIVLAAIL